MKRLLLAAASLLAACATIQPAPGGGFEVVPATASASPGGVVRLAASLATGAPPVVTWTVTGGGSIAPDGTFTAPGCASALPATVTITAASSSFSATSTISVADKVTSVTVSPPTVTLAPGATQVFTATVRSVCFPAGAAQLLKMKRPANGGPATVEAVASRSP